MTYYVRTERPEDALEVARVVARAFEGGDEAPVAEVALVEALRQDAAWMPGLSIVAVQDRQVVGHALGSRVLVGGAPAVGVAPVSVLPELQGRGIGTALLRRLVSEARSVGETLLVVLGDPAYYSRFGFSSAADLGVIGPYAGEALRALPLAADAPVGMIAYPPPFATSHL